MRNSSRVDSLNLSLLTHYCQLYFQEGKHSKSKVEKFSSFLFTFILVGLTLYYVVYRPAVGGLLGNLSATEILPEDVDITFDDVRGCEEAKEELQANIIGDRPKDVFTLTAETVLRQIGYSELRPKP